ncbi:DUF3099 domain-containing protein [Haloechinothrix sp. LS1_15]|uniref:DUF3099 domain-containing protein n=1 Tax=Haloechinothrix sp. LS1_15 TaxID=2652248 RepID=UPI0029468D08|nr:DUF3099 domain-containing protein [Haloechinothrix sp. LS1_15]MDV6014472.1 DUF3099 domain-containing protein [Haloechinothrix sp. LS1_15]
MSWPKQDSGEPEGPVLITEAEPSYDDELAARKRKYVWMMGLRFPCLILAGIFYQIPWLAVTLVVIAVPLPWIAVLIANDRPARKAESASTFRREPRALDEGGHRVIDG